MPSNVRKYDKSCHSLADGVKKFYQCQTCDQTKQVYLCADCFDDGDHNNHNYRVATNYTDIAFCNCGDITGKLICSEHRVIKFKNTLKLPLHFNKKFFDGFIKRLNFSDQAGRKLARLNQIREVYYKSEDGKLIKTYFDQSNAHKSPIYIRKSYSVYRKDHELRFVEKQFDQERRLLLWHGTKLKNVDSILQNGFRRPNQGGVAHGSMFGTGVYFADRVSKSTNYTDQTGVEVLFLCEVALGSMYRTGLPKDYKNAPSKFNSIKGLGKNVPDKNDRDMFDDVIVPTGKTIPNPHPKIIHSQLFYNEYITFDPDRILIKFIVIFDRDATKNKSGT